MRGTIAWDYVIRIALLLGLLIILIIAIMKLSGAGTALWERIKAMFVFGG